MLRVRSSDSELEIEGTSAEFEHLRRKVSGLDVTGGRISISCDGSIDPAPYSEIHKELIVELDSGCNRFVVTPSSVRIVGGAEALKSLSANLPIGAVIT